MLFYATWNVNAYNKVGVKLTSFQLGGYVEADTLSEATEIAKEHLSKDAELIDVCPAHTEPTPQSITINFQNTSQYTLFG